MRRNRIRKHRIGGATKLAGLAFACLLLFGLKMNYIESGWYGNLESLEEGGNFTVGKLLGDLEAKTFENVPPVSMVDSVEPYWQRFWGGYMEDVAWGVAAGSDGVYVAVETWSYSAGMGDALLLKYADNGDPLWENNPWGGEDYDAGYGVAVESDGVYVAGVTYSYSAGLSDAFLLKYTDNGALMWENTWGGSGGDGAKGVAVGSDGIYVTGFTSGDVFLLKYNENGNLLWENTWDRRSDDRANGVAVGGDGIYVAGYTSGDVFLLKYNENGNLVWENTWGGGSDDRANGVAVGSDGIYVAGSTASYGAGMNDVFLLKYNENGNLVWGNTWGGESDDRANGVAVGSDGIYVAGYTPEYGDGSALLLKYADNGDLLWERFWGGSGGDVAFGVAVGGDGIYVAGYTDSYGTGSHDVFLLKYMLDHIPPQAPELISPENGTIISDNNPTFMWTPVYDPSSVIYTLQYSTDSTFQIVATIENLMDNTYTVSSALADNTYYWRVRAVDGASNASDWSEVWQFTVDTTPPPAPTLVTPRNGATLRDSTPWLDWSDVSDLSGVTYHLQVLTSSVLYRVVYEKSGILPRRHELESALQNDKYSWRVRAVDGTGNVGAWSSAWRFKVIALEPIPL